VTVERIRAIVSRHGRLTNEMHTLADTDDLYRAGLTSHASVSLMLALEDEFDLEFDEAHLTRTTFASVSAIHRALTELSGPATSVA
jgi:acyl carrier protein